MMPVGLIAALLTQPLAVGAEELVRWQTIVFANKTAMYFMVLGGIGVVGGLYWQRAKTAQKRVAVIGITATLLILAAWRMSLLSPFDIALQ